MKLFIHGGMNMQVYLYIEINIFAIIILLLIYMNIRRRSYKYLTEQTLYMTLLILNLSILIFDTFTWVLDGINIPFYKSLLTMTTIFYYLLHPVICMFWALYVDFQINRNKNRIKKMTSKKIFYRSIATKNRLR